MKQEHYKNHVIERGNWDRLSQTFLAVFTDLLWYLDKLKVQKRINPHYHLTQIIELMKYYDNADMRKAFEVSNNYNMYSYTFIEGYLQKHSKVLQKINSISIKRDLNEYKFPGLQLNSKSEYEVYK